MLLIDEIDRSDQEFEAFLLEFLSDFQISIPERGTIRAAERPVVILTSNRTRDLHEALRRRCVYHWIDYPNAEREARIVMLRASSVAEATARAVVAAVGKLRREPLSKSPGISESVDWAEAATLLNRGGARWPDAFKRSIGVALKDEEDLAYVSGPPRRHARRVGRMSEIAPPPRAVEPFIGFVAILRANGFAVAPEQTKSFLSAIVLLGPRDPDDIRRAGLATLAPPPERHAAYHALFDMHFLGAKGRTCRKAKRRTWFASRKTGAARTNRSAPTSRTNPVRLRLAPKRLLNAASARRKRVKLCAVWRAKPLGVCRSG